VKTLTKSTLSKKITTPKEEENSKVVSNKEFDDRFNDQEIESLIRKQTTVPILVFDYIADNESEGEFAGWDIKDLNYVFSQFGEILNLETTGKFAVVFFKLYIDAYTAKEYFSNLNNFKDGKSNFKVKWFDKQYESFVSAEMLKTINLFKKKPKRIIKG